MVYHIRIYYRKKRQVTDVLYTAYIMYSNMVMWFSNDYMIETGCLVYNNVVIGLS